MNNYTTDNAGIAQSADESFRVDLSWSVVGGYSDYGHGSSKILWTYMLKHKNESISRYFGLEDMNPDNKPWYIDGADNARKGSDWEATIFAQDSSKNYFSNGTDWTPIELDPRIKVAY